MWASHRPVTSHTRHDCVCSCIKNGTSPWEFDFTDADQRIKMIPATTLREATANHATLVTPAELTAIIDIFVTCTMF